MSPRIGRPLKNPEDGRRKPITVYLPVRMVEELDGATAPGETRSDVVTEAVRAEIEHRRLP